MSSVTSTQLRDRRIYTPSQLNSEGQVVLEEAFGAIWLEGEMSNFSRPASGHWYFTLKDARAQVRCAMFRNRNTRLRFEPAAGLQVLLRARVSLYVARGEFQCIVEHMEPAGEGALRLAFDQLRARLEAEGLFDAERKRPLPALPRRIALITSASGAAVRDMLNVTARRWPVAEIMLLPAAVQGADAPGEIVAALERLNRLVASQPDLAPDLVITGRGGGSLEDLQAFNDERVARAIVACAVPVVAAVGHETDFTIADFVADLRAPTPSAAAELATPDAAEWLAGFAGLQAGLTGAVRRRLQRRAEHLGHVRRRLRHPGTLLQERAQRLDELDMRLRRGMAMRQRRQGDRLKGVAARLRQAGPRARLLRDVQQLGRLRGRLRRLLDELRPGAARAGAVEALQQRLLRATRNRLTQLQQRQRQAAGRLDALSPLRVLDRGYALLLREQDARIVRNADDVAVGDRLQARLARGSLRLQVLQDPEQD